MRRKTHTRFWWGEVKEEFPLKDVGMSGRVVLKWIMEKLGARAWTRVSRFGVGTSGGLL
jgi:hypothetical protein